MSDLLGIGASAVRAYSHALNVVGNNIANAETPGYARRRALLGESSPVGALPLFRTNIRSQGVLVNGLSRSVDQWLVQDARATESQAGLTSSRAYWLTAAEAALDDGAGGIGAAITSVFNAGDRLASSPNDSALRSDFLLSVDNAARSFRTAGSRMAELASALAGDAQSITQDVNSDLAALADVNNGLLRARDGSDNQASLLDRRDALLDRISGNLQVTTTFGDKGVVTLVSDNAVAEPLVEGINAATISVSAQSNGTLVFSLSTSNQPLVPASGQLAGLSLAAEQLAQQRDSIDAQAGEFADSLNAWHRGGITDDGQAGADLLSFGGVAAALTAVALTAEDLALADNDNINGNILSLDNVRRSGGAETQWSAFAAAQAQATALAQSQASAALARRDDASAARDSVSGVDLDREAAELLRFQQAYQGAARIIQVARETLQTLFDAT
jgi:flagellar hook-associated protein 1 FlgK